MNVLGYKSIKFVGGKKLIIPVIDSLTMEPHEYVKMQAGTVIGRTTTCDKHDYYKFSDWFGFSDNTTYTDSEAGRWKYIAEERSGSGNTRVLHSELEITPYQGNPISMFNANEQLPSSFPNVWLYQHARVCWVLLKEGDDYSLRYANFVDGYHCVENADGILSSSTGVRRTWQAILDGQFTSASGIVSNNFDQGPWWLYNLSSTQMTLSTGTIPSLQYLVDAMEDEDISDDPNDKGGTSGTGGGGGNFDDTSDPINIPALPTLNATNAGFVTLYKPNLNEMIALAKRLWSPNVLDLVSQLFGDPMDLVIGLGIVPVSAPANSTSSPSIGPIVIPLVLSVYDSQYYSYDCGTIDIQEYWGSALDYAPYTKIDIYLPYVGVRSLNVDEVMGHTVGVTYHIDLFGGAVVAFVTVDGSVRYQFSGNCMQQIPVGKADYSQLIQNLVSVACVVGTGVAAAGTAGAAAAVGEESAALGAGTASQGGAIASGWFGSEYADVRALGFSEWSDTGGGKALANCTMNAVMNSKPAIERTGAMSATNGQLSVQTPFVIITRPRQSLPEGYKHYGGYPSNITARLGDLSGYTKVDSIRINDLAATEPELTEIYSLLKKGVII